jgi:hypothetical protein
MMNIALSWIARATAVLSATGVGGITLALAGEGLPTPPPVHYSGLINDYTPSSAVVKNGPYEMRGKWSLDVDPRRGTTKFSAVMNMETSDYGMSELVANPQGVLVPLVDKDNPGTRDAHTHHIVMTDGMINADLATTLATCPKFSPAVTGGFLITGHAYITGNGNPARFGAWSPLTLCILGSADVTYSNITLTFGMPANTHFGMFAIHGVILGCAGPWEFESKDCTVQETVPE